jgi:hypothetical protein
MDNCGGRLQDNCGGCLLDIMLTREQGCVFLYAEGALPGSAVSAYVLLLWLRYCCGSGGRCKHPIYVVAACILCCSIDATTQHLGQPVMEPCICGSFSA